MSPQAAVSRLSHSTWLHETSLSRAAPSYSSSAVQIAVFTAPRSAAAATSVTCGLSAGAKVVKFIMVVSSLDEISRFLDAVAHRVWYTSRRLVAVC